MRQHLFNPSTAKILLTGLLIWSASAGQQVLADGAKIFTGPPPQAEELAAMLFSPQAEPEVRTRSIVFIDPNNTAKAPVRVAKAPTKRAYTAPTKRAQKAPKKRAQKAPAKRVSKAPAKRQERPERSGGFGFLINFALNSSEILPDSRPYLDQVGKMMGLPEAKDQKILIEGHTDASGSAGYNKQLSVSRAQAVKEYLIRQHKVSPQQLVTVGKGEYDLLPGRSPLDGMNRRVEFYRADL